MSDEPHPFVTRFGALFPGPVSGLSTEYHTTLNTNRKLFFFLPLPPGNNLRKFQYVCVLLHYRAGQQLPNAISKGHSQRARIHNCRQLQQGILGRKTKTDALMFVGLFFYDRKVQLGKPEALAINLFSLWAQGLHRNSSSSDIYLGRLQRTLKQYLNCVTLSIYSANCTSWRHKCGT